MFKISFNGLQTLKQHEGSVLRSGKHRVYDDATGFEIMYGEPFKGFPTLGYGHLLTRDELTSEAINIDGERIRYWSGITEAQAIWLLDKDLDWAENTVNKSVSVDINQNQFDALVSFTFNIGPEAFKNSTLLKKLNAGNFDEVPGQFARWIRSGGRIVNGLIKRRNAEANLFMS